MSKGICTPSAESVVTSMAFFLLASAIMAASILLLHKVAAFFGCRVKYKALALSAVLAFLVNFVSIRFTPYLTQARYVCLFVFIVITSLGATIYNAKLLRRERRRELQDGLDAFEEHAAKSQEVSSVVLSEEATEKETLPVEKTLVKMPSETLPEETESVAELAKDEISKEATIEKLDTEPPASLLKGDASPTDTSQAKEKPLQNVSEEKEPVKVTTTSKAKVVEPVPVVKVNKVNDKPKQVTPKVKPQAEVARAETISPKTTTPIPVASISRPEAKKEPSLVVSPKTDASTAALKSTKEKKEIPTKIAPLAKSVPAKDKSTREAHSEAKATPLPTNATAKVAQKEVATPAMSNVPPKKATIDVTIDVKTKHTESPKVAKVDNEEVFNQALQQQTTLDELLNLAFAEKEQNHLVHAERAYREALRRYRQDPYAPFIVTEWGNVCKEMGNLALAAVAFDSARALPTVQNDVGMQKAFAENARYLRAVDAVLKAKGLRNVPFPKIDPALLREAEAKVHP